jgi:hypothetical protein
MYTVWYVRANDGATIRVTDVDSDLGASEAEPYLNQPITDLRGRKYYVTGIESFTWPKPRAADFVVRLQEVRPN